MTIDVTHLFDEWTMPRALEPFERAEVCFWEIISARGVRPEHLIFERCGPRVFKFGNSYRHADLERASPGWLGDPVSKARWAIVLHESGFWDDTFRSLERYLVASDATK